MIVLNLVASLSSMALFSTPALSLVTGYDYNGANDNPTTAAAADQYGDLKCTYLFAGITLMRFLKLMLDDEQNPTGVPVGMLGHYDIRAAICTLYGVTNVEIGSLWLLLLYANTVPYYYKKYINDKANEAGRTPEEDELVVIHDYVLDRMQKELSAAGCRPGNRFDTYGERYVRLTADMPKGGKPKLHHIQNDALYHCHELDKLFKANRAQSTFGTRYESLKARLLFVENLGINKFLKSKLMTAYDVQVGWGETFESLTQYWEDAHKFHSPTVLPLPLFSVKSYYKAVFGLFKCIMYRLTWKFVLYVDTLTAERRYKHLKKWHDLLVEFQNLLRLQHDRDVANLLVAIVRLGNNKIVVDNVITKLRVKVHDIKVFLRFEAANEMILRPEQFSSSAVEVPSRQVDIDWSSVKDADVFIAELKHYFRLVDFDVIRSFVTYISDEKNW